MINKKSEEKLRQLFKNRFDCYADMEDDSVVMAMSEKGFIEVMKEALGLFDVSESIVADVRNKLSPPKNLCAILEDMHVTKKLDSDIAEIIEQNIKQTKISIAYLSDISVYSR